MCLLLVFFELFKEKWCRLIKHLTLGVAQIRELGVYFNYKEMNPMHFLYIYMIIYLHFTSRKLSTKKGQTNKITGPPDTNIPESTCEYKITNNNNKYIYIYIYIYVYI